MRLHLLILTVFALAFAPISISTPANAGSACNPNVQSC